MKASKVWMCIKIESDTSLMTCKHSVFSPLLPYLSNCQHYTRKNTIEERERRGRGDFT